MSPTDRLPRLLQDFFRVHLVARRNLSDHTVQAYRDALVLLLRFAATRSTRHVTRLDLMCLGQPTVLAFLEDLETHRGNGIRTRNARLAAIHSFFRYVAEEEPAAAEVCRRVLSIPAKRAPQAALVCLSREEITHLLDAPDGTTCKGRRDTALFWFLYNTGARAQEAVDVRLPALRLSAPAQVRLYGKGRKERLCPLWSATVERLRDTLRDRGIAEDVDQPLFLNAAGRPLTRFGVRHIVRHPRSPAHSRGVLLLQAFRASRSAPARARTRMMSPRCPATCQCTTDQHPQGSAFAGGLHQGSETPLFRHIHINNAPAHPRSQAGPRTNLGTP
jgi:site-specific recombinase XerD